MTFSVNLVYPNVPLSGVWRLRGSVSREASPDYVDPVLLEASLDDSRRELFELYADAWIEDTKWLSSIPSILGHPNFTNIVRMGLPAAKLILGRMQQGDVRVHWFPALKDIAGGIDPVPPQERGIVTEMAKRWIEWGKARGYV